MTQEKYDEAQRLTDAINYLVWEINMLENAQEHGVVAVYPDGDANQIYRVVLKGEQVTKAIREWLEAKRAELAEKRAEFERL